MFLKVCSSDLTRYYIDVNSVVGIRVEINLRQLTFFFNDIVKNDTGVNNINFYCDSVTEIQNIIKEYKKLGGKCYARYYHL